jgi:hypothetical protein
VALLFLSVAGIRAEDAKSQTPAAPAAEGACKQDADKLCPGLTKGDGKLGPCMKEHKDELSQACKDEMTAGMAKHKEKLDAMKAKLDAACGADADKFCKGLKPGDGKYGACMKEHKDEVSQGCKDAMTAGMEKRKEKMEGRKKELEAACASDTDKFCKGTTPGDKKWGPCMKDHKDELSDTCKSAWKDMMHEMHEHMGGGKKEGGTTGGGAAPDTSAPDQKK